MGGSRGKGLVNSNLDPSNLRLRTYNVTKRGQAVANTLAEKLAKLLA